MTNEYKQTYLLMRSRGESRQAAKRFADDCPQFSSYLNSITPDRAEKLMQLGWPKTSRQIDKEYFANRRKAKKSRNLYYVALGSANRAYGGPEEGGWWFNTWEPIEVVFTSPKYRKAEKALEHFQGTEYQLNADGLNRDISSVNCIGRLQYRLSRGIPEPEPKYAPRYC